MFTTLHQHSYCAYDDNVIIIQIVCYIHYSGPLHAIISQDSFITINKIHDTMKDCLGVGWGFSGELPLLQEHGFLGNRGFYISNSL